MSPQRRRNVAASVRDRLLALARQRGEDFQRVLGRYAHPTPAEADFPTLLDHATPRLRVYPREAVVAEKFHIMVTLGMANSRMKDFADALARAIAATFARRRTPLPEAPPLALTAEFAEDRGKRTQWRALASRARLDLGEHKLGEVVALLRDFLLPPTAAAARRKAFASFWTAGGPWQASPSRRR